MINMASGLLIVGQPLMFTKECAIRYGVHMAVFLQQSHFMISRYGKEKEDGVRWLRWSHDKWHTKVFPFWAERTLRNLMYEATEKGWLLVQKEPGATALYAINYEQLGGAFKGSRVVENATPQAGKKCQPQGGKKCHPAAHIERDTEKREEEREKTSRKLRPVLTAVRKRTPASSFSATALQKPAAENKVKISATEVEKSIREKLRKKAIESISARPTTETLINFWRRTLADYGISSMSLSFTGKERGMIRSLVKQFTDASNGKAGTHLAVFLEFSVAHWDELKAKIVWDNNPNRSKLHKIPNISEVYYNREDILHYMQNPKGVIKEEVKREIYTDLAMVPKNHPKYQDIALAIKHTGHAVLS